MRSDPRFPPLRRSGLPPEAFGPRPPIRSIKGRPIRRSHTLSSDTGTPSAAHTGKRRARAGLPPEAVRPPPSHTRGRTRAPRRPRRIFPPPRRPPLFRPCRSPPSRQKPGRPPGRLPPGAPVPAPPVLRSAGNPKPERSGIPGDPREYRPAPPARPPDLPDFRTSIPLRTPSRSPASDALRPAHIPQSDTGPRRPRSRPERPRRSGVPDSRSCCLPPQKTRSRTPRPSGMHRKRGLFVPAKRKSRPPPTPRGGCSPDIPQQSAPEPDKAENPAIQGRRNSIPA